MVISVDTGNKMIKTEHYEFNSGIDVLDTIPGENDEVIEFGGKYYRTTNRRISYMEDKTEDDRYYILQREIDLDSSVFFEWNLSVNSGNYRLKSVEATQNDQKYVAEFDNNYKNLPEQGLIIMKIKVKNELVEAVQTEKKQNKTDQQNNIQNPEKSDSGIKNTEVVTTVKKTGQKTGIIIGGLSFLGAAMWLLYRKFHRKK